MGIRFIAYLSNTSTWIEGFVKMLYNYLLSMGNIIKGLLEYLSNTPKDQIEKDLKRLDKYNNIGPSVDEYIRKTKRLKRNVKK